MTTKDNPFAILGLAPTLDQGQIKRAYFRLLGRHSPHADPEGFRRIRDAYEALMGPGLHAALATAPLDVDAELEPLERELGPRIAEAKQRYAELEDRRRALASFAALLRLDLASARVRSGIEHRAAPDAKSGAARF